MSQNYIKSLKVDEYAWQTIYFRGSIGRDPRHLAPVWQDNAPRYKMNVQDNHWAAAVQHGIVSYAWYGAHRQPLHAFYSLYSFK